MYSHEIVGKINIKRLVRKGTNMKIIKRFVLLLGILMLVGCGNRERIVSTEYYIYDIDKDESRVNNYVVEIEETETKSILQELFCELQKSPEKTTDKCALPEDVKMIGYRLEENHLALDFSVDYLDMDSVREVLTRAAIVRTLCQVDDVQLVSFMVEGEPLTTMNGYTPGLMSEEQFVDNAGKEINSYEKAELTLYFANEAGNRLVAHKVECVYNSNISMDKLVVEQLVAGPKNGDSTIDGFGTMNTETQILSVTTQDGVCYVNLSENFSIRKGYVLPEVTIYSIVNSLIELPGVNRVQISIDGNSELNYLETISLSLPFERNLEIVDDAQ